MADFEVKYSTLSEYYNEKLWPVLDEMNRKASGYPWKKNEWLPYSGIFIRLVDTGEHIAQERSPGFQILKTNLLVITIFTKLKDLEKSIKPIAVLKDFTLAALQRLETDINGKEIGEFNIQFVDFLSRYDAIDGGDPNLSLKGQKILLFDLESRKRDVMRWALKDSEWLKIPKVGYSENFRDFRVFLDYLVSNLDAKLRMEFIVRLLVEGYKGIERLTNQNDIEDVQIAFMNSIRNFLDEKIIPPDNGEVNFYGEAGVESMRIRDFLFMLDQLTEKHCHVSALPSGVIFRKLTGKRNFAIWVNFQ